MSSGKAPAGFPDVEAKLAKPVKQSAFDKAKAEAEAKRKRDEADTAAVYEDFVKSFDHGDDERAPSGPGPRPPRHGFGGPSSGVTTGKRHFAQSGMKKSGPGSLGPVPASFGGRRSFNHDFYKGSRGRGVESQGGAISVSQAFNASDDDDIQREAIERAELKAIAKPQLRLSNMPLGVSPAAIKALLPEGLTVEAVKIEPPTGPGSHEGHCTNAVVTLSRDSPGSAMDAAVSSLQNRYLGWGHYLSAHRHLSSAVLNPVGGPPSSSSAAQPFGAKPMEQMPGTVGQQGSHRGFAPPSSYNQSSSVVHRTDQFYVPVTPPEDIRMIRHIHKTVERVLEHGAELEALLMSRPEVQHDEKWAWMWDETSVGGIWYRWRLWELATGYQADPQREPYVYLFEDSPPWKVPDPLPFEFVTDIEEFTSHPDYNTSDDEDMDGDGNRGRNNGAELETPFLGPLDKAKLIHLLARLPTSLSKLRRGDIARVTAFALAHADRGPSEVVDVIVCNIGRPLAFTGANPNNHQPKETRQVTGTEDESASEEPDTSAASLIGLYVVSDILSSSSTTAIRHAWRFRGLIEKELGDRQVFDFLGMMPERRGWGRLRAEKWRRSIGLVLNLWESWNVFPGKQELFARTFESPPSLKAEEDKVDDVSSHRGTCKAVEPRSATAGKVEAAERETKMKASEAEDDVKGQPIDDDDVEGEPIADEDVHGEPIDEDDVKGEPIDEDDVEGEPIMDEDVQGEPMDEDDVKAESMDEDDETNGNDKHHDGHASSGANGTGDGDNLGDSGREEPSQRQGPAQKRKRIRAVDMFANSDEAEGPRP
ncbi:U2 snRNP-associated SURP motif-containing protein [Tolypocladium paradoxum]|uniref:U2 snRNP-associated SURP motif-containing protein n=1 Tax=Tolypocladium paradoxum TaxID=94208 RepID=A0A2S4KMW3_9HYPO|nr:U2 snRNP-associated SURP motif-containing protein [Tolypocladium paradoxum]